MTFENVSATVGRTLQANATGDDDVVPRRIDRHQVGPFVVAGRFVRTRQCLPRGVEVEATSAEMADAAARAIRPPAEREPDRWKSCPESWPHLCHQRDRAVTGLGSLAASLIQSAPVPVGRPSLKSSPRRATVRSSKNAAVPDRRIDRVWTSRIHHRVGDMIGAHDWSSCRRHRRLVQPAVTGHVDDVRVVG